MNGFLIVLGGRDTVFFPSVSLCETLGIPGYMDNVFSSVGIVPLDLTEERQPCAWVAQSKVIYPRAHYESPLVLLHFRECSVCSQSSMTVRMSLVQIVNCIDSSYYQLDISRFQCFHWIANMYLLKKSMMPCLTEETCCRRIVHHAPAVRYTAPLLSQPHRCQDMQILLFIFFNRLKKLVDQPKRSYRLLRTLHAKPSDKIVIQYI